MRYIKMTISYMFRNGWRLLITVLPLAVILAFVFSVFDSVSALYYLTRSKPSGITEVAEDFGVTLDWMLLIKAAAAILASAVFISYTYIAVYKHFRTGKFSIRTPIRYINSGFIPVLKLVILIALYVALYKSVMISIIALYTTVFNALGAPYLVSVILDYVLIIAGFCFGNYILLTPMLMLSHMFVYGYSTIEAWNSCNRVAKEGRTAKSVVAVLLPALICVVMNYFFIAVSIPYWASIIIRTAVYAFVIAYYVTFALTIMFEFSQFERRDIESKSWEV